MNVTYMPNAQSWNQSLQLSFSCFLCSRRSTNSRYSRYRYSYHHCLLARCYRPMWCRSPSHYAQPSYRSTPLSSACKLESLFLCSDKNFCFETPTFPNCPVYWAVISFKTSFLMHQSYQSAQASSKKKLLLPSQRVMSHKSWPFDRLQQLAGAFKNS